MRLAAVHRYSTAVNLIQRGLRLSIVVSATGLPPKQLRSLYREVPGKGPLPGPLPSSSRIISTRKRQAMASLFAGFYQSAGGHRIWEGIDIPALLSSFDLYCELVQVALPAIELLEINQAWVIARDLHAGILRFESCRDCRIQYISLPDGRLSPGCPVCVLKR